MYWISLLPFFILVILFRPLGLWAVMVVMVWLIYNYLCNQCLSPLTFWVRIPLRRYILNTPLCDKVCQWLGASRWCFLGTPVSSPNMADRHDMTEILLKVALNTNPLVYLLPKILELFDFPIFWLWVYLMKIVREKHRDRSIRYLRFYSYFNEKSLSCSETDNKTWFPTTCSNYDYI